MEEVAIKNAQGGGNALLFPVIKKIISKYPEKFKKLKINQ